MIEFGDIITIRRRYENYSTRTNEESYAFVQLGREFPFLQKTKAPLFRNEGLYIPILYVWRQEEGVKLVGVLIISGLGELDSNKKAQKSKERPYEAKKGGKAKEPLKLTNNAFLRELCAQLGSFMNICIVDMLHRKVEMNFRGVSKMSKKRFKIALVTIFKTGPDIRITLKEIRTQLPDIFDYEDCALLIKDKQGKLVVLLTTKRETISTQSAQTFLPTN
jgi:hypothetical protein